MKFLITLACIVVLSFSVIVASKNGENPVIKEFCLKNSTITEAEVTAAKSLKYKNASPQVQCYVNCKLQMYGYFKKGQPSYPLLSKYLIEKYNVTSTDATAMLDKCKPQMTGSGCAPIFNFSVCLKDSYSSKKSDRKSKA